MAHLPTNAWFVAQVVPSTEAKVAAMLEQKGYQQFSPTNVAQKKWSDRIKVQKEPLFPGYVFVRISSEGYGGLLCSTPGVIRILTFAGKPVPISDTEIDAIRTLTYRGKPQPTQLVTTGERVQIKDGPFAGIVGIVKQIRDRACLIFTVQLISQSIYVEVDAYQLEPVSLSHKIGSTADPGATRESERSTVISA